MSQQLLKLAEENRALKSSHATEVASLHSEKVCCERPWVKFRCWCLAQRCSVSPSPTFCQPHEPFCRISVQADLLRDLATTSASNETLLEDLMAQKQAYQVQCRGPHVGNSLTHAQSRQPRCSWLHTRVAIPVRTTVVL